MRTLNQLFLQLKRIWEMPEQYQDMYNYVTELYEKINENTTVHADISYKGKGDGSQVIVVGRYRNKDYVRSFNVRTNSLESLINLLKEEEKGASVGRFDMIGAMEFSAVYDRDTF